MVFPSRGRAPRAGVPSSRDRYKIPSSPAASPRINLRARSPRSDGRGSPSCARPTRKTESKSDVPPIRRSATRLEEAVDRLRQMPRSRRRPFCASASTSSAESLGCGRGSLTRADRWPADRARLSGSLCTIAGDFRRRRGLNIDARRWRLVCCFHLFMIARSLLDRGHPPRRVSAWIRPHSAGRSGGGAGEFLVARLHSPATNAKPCRPSQAQRRPMVSVQAREIVRPARAMDRIPGRPSRAVCAGQRRRCAGNAPVGVGRRPLVSTCSRPWSCKRSTAPGDLVAALEGTRRPRPPDVRCSATLCASADGGRPPSSSSRRRCAVRVFALALHLGQLPRNATGAWRITLVRNRR